MDGQRQPSRWVWALLAVVLLAGGVASTGATVSGEQGPSPRGGEVGGGVAGSGHVSREPRMHSQAPLRSQEHVSQASPTGPYAGTLATPDPLLTCRMRSEGSEYLLLSKGLERGVWVVL